MTERVPDLIVEHNGVEIGLARPRLRDAMLLDSLSSKLPDAKGIQFMYQYGWCKAVSRTIYVKNLKYRLPTIASTVREVRDAYEAFLELDGELAEKWGEGVRQLETPTVPIHETPLEDVPVEIQTDPNSLSGVLTTQTPSLPS